MLVKIDSLITKLKLLSKCIVFFLNINYLNKEKMRKAPTKHW